MDSKLTTDLNLGRGRNLRFWLLERPRVFYPSSTLFLVYSMCIGISVECMIHTSEIATLRQSSHPDLHGIFQSKGGFKGIFKSSGYYFSLSQIWKYEGILLSSVSVIYVFQAVETKDHTGASVLVQYINYIMYKHACLVWDTVFKIIYKTHWSQQV